MTTTPDLPDPGESLREHSTYGWRQGCRCRICSYLHLIDLQLHRAERAERRLPAAIRRYVVNEVRAGRPPVMVAKALGIPIQRIWNYARTHPVWHTELDDALMLGRDPAIPHGTTGYRWFGCFCPRVVLLTGATTNLAIRPVNLPNGCARCDLMRPTPVRP